VESRPVELRLLLEGAQSQTVELPADSPELTRLLQMLARRGSTPQGNEEFFQLPLDGGRESLSFSSAQLVAVTTRPPVLVQFEEPAAVPAPVPASAVPGQIFHAPHMVIDDFLSPYEHRDMLAYALKQQGTFGTATVATGVLGQRENLVILDFAQAAHSRLLCNRLLTWFPFILGTLGMDPFPVQRVESQLTASNDGHYYRAHVDADEQSGLTRALTCVYYFSRQPVPYTGGALRLYDSVLRDGRRDCADSYRDVQPRSNRMVVFPSAAYHELRPIRCPGGRFEDSRFAVTTWLWGGASSEQAEPQGWGHMDCSRLPDWQAPAGSEA